MIKNSLTRIKIILKTKYLTNTSAMKLLVNCNNHYIDKTYKDCYYFKRTNEYFDFIQTK